MFTGFSLIGLLPHTPADLATEHSAIAAAVAKLAADQAAWEEARAALADQPMRNAKDLVGATGKLKDSRISLLLDELRLRERYGSWLLSCRGALSEMAKQARQDHEAIKADVRRRLVSIGYKDTTIPGDRGAITPGMVMIHPECRAAVEKVEGLQLESTLAEHDRANDVGIEAIQVELEETKRKLMAV